MTDEERFWMKVDKRGDCWLWMAGTKNKKGYGDFWVNGRSVTAHRHAWELTNGHITDDLCCLHRCDVPACVNPDHLFLGTRADNNADCVAKGRTAKGDKNGMRLHPEKRPRGDRHGSRTHPEKVPRGDTHGSKIHPEKWARGDAHGSRTHPEKLARGDRNGARMHPEKVARGSKHGSAKLTEKDIPEIRRRLATGELQKAIAVDYAVGLTVISSIKLGRTWSHVTS